MNYPLLHDRECGIAMTQPAHSSALRVAPDHPTQLRVYDPGRCTMHIPMYPHRFLEYFLLYHPITNGLVMDGVDVRTADYSYNCDCCRYNFLKKISFNTKTC